MAPIAWLPKLLAKRSLLELGSRKWSAAFRHRFTRLLEFEVVVSTGHHWLDAWNSDSDSGLHSSIPLRDRGACFGSRAPRRAERQILSESCYKRCEVSLPCNTEVPNCTRVCMSDRKGKTGLNFDGAGLRLLDIPGSTYLACGVTSPTPISEAPGTRTSIWLRRSPSTPRACYKAPLDRGTRYQQQMFGRLWLAHRLS